ncbi:MAG TPA: hypothetical protein P5121_24805, partial [Caldilineaceae bacterium]|nr:hypothetical protein [Caldilineaceae bacterium]
HNPTVVADDRVQERKGDETKLNSLCSTHRALILLRFFKLDDSAINRLVLVAKRGNVSRKAAKSAKVSLVFLDELRAFA